MSKFYDRHSTAIIICGLLIASALSWAHLLAFGLTDMLWAILICPIAGGLLLSFITDKKLAVGEHFCYSAGLGIALTMLIGLGLDMYGLLTNFPSLQPHILIEAFDVVLLILLAIARSLGKGVKQLPGLRFERVQRPALLALTPLLFPLVTVLGAIRLNNGGSNAIALFGLALIIIYDLALVLAKRGANDNSYLLALVCSCFALMLSVSMRSSYLIGADIHNEFRVFLPVLQSKLWQPGLGDSTYNACLSITVLPAVLKAFFLLSPTYIFKFLMQFVIAIVPVCVFLIAKMQFKNSKLSYLAALFFVVQYPLMIEFTSLIRQQVALLFFGLLVVAAICEKLEPRSKRWLIIVFGVSMAVSHYSTTYVALGLFAVAVLLRLSLRFKRRIRRLDMPKLDKWYMPGVLVSALFLFTFLWYGQMLQSTGGIGTKLVQSVSHLDEFFNQDTRSSFILSTFHLGDRRPNSQTIQGLMRTNKVRNGYIESTYSNYLLLPMQPAAAQPNSTFQYNYLQITDVVIPLIVKVVISLGAVYMVFLAWKRKLDIEYGLLVIGAGVAFALLVLLPNLSQDYNIERLYQQLLIVIAGAIIFGCSIIAKTNHRILVGLTSAIIFAYMACTTGIANQIVFRISDINLNNNGATYDNFYTRSGEYDSIQWLNKAAKNNTVNFDHYSILNSWAYATLPSAPYKAQQGLLPSELPMAGYVFASYTNIHQGIASEAYLDQQFTYSFPGQFLDDNKNTVYANQDSRIYR